MQTPSEAALPEKGHVAASWVGAVAVAASLVWTAVGVGLAVWSVRLAGTDEVHAPPLGLGLVAALVPVVLAGAAWGVRLGQRLRHGDPSVQRPARWWFAAFLAVAVAAVPVVLGDGSVQPAELALIVVSAGPVLALVVDRV